MLMPSYSSWAWSRRNIYEVPVEDPEREGRGLTKPVHDVRFELMIVERAHVRRDPHGVFGDPDDDGVAPGRE